ncbi:MAG: cob(I)yrinic acid a,c-diamide adenosyltransferase [Candidatus Chaera renei]|uniref:Cob(I)yrinic acid a,c-diamide adenosyltransferase n=1 Tax=Candidatus Chaera renei TaxID=2506947 RepID=A0A4Q0AK28_9BACT|nr:MAG: cob(I)yrinic acid a,c-diamide adenosyltransferase [Candidatus Chaera renei]
MAFEDYRQKPSVVVVYTGAGKGKTSAGLGLMCRALGTGWRVAFVQFIKDWEVGEHQFIKKIASLFKGQLTVHKGGRGFYHAGELSPAGISDDEHRQAAGAAFEFAYQAAISGEYQLVICDEINNALYHGLIKRSDFTKLIKRRAAGTSLCLTGRNFPESLLPLVDIATNMTKLRHHFDEKFLANQGIDY